MISGGYQMISRKALNSSFQAIEDCREQLRHYVASRLDRRLSSRVDASDIVQETFLDASRRLPEFLQLDDEERFRRLKQLAIERTVDACRRHLQAQRRTVLRERKAVLQDSTANCRQTIDTLADTNTSVGGKLSRQEELEQVGEALEKLSPADRELIVLRHLVQLDVAELAELLDTTRTVITTRHLRAIGRLRQILESNAGD